MKKEIIIKIAVPILIIGAITLFYKPSGDKQQNNTNSTINDRVSEEDKINQDNLSSHNTMSFVVPEEPDYLKDGMAIYEYTLSDGNKVNISICEKEIVAEGDVLNNHNVENFIAPFDAEYTLDVLDYDRIEKDYPELYEYVKNKGIEQYTDEYSKKMKELQSEIYNDYLVSIHPKTNYIFVKCSFENLQSEEITFDSGILSLCMIKEPYSRVDRFYSSYFEFLDDNITIESSDLEVSSKNNQIFHLDAKGKTDIVIGYKVYSVLDWIDISEARIYIGNEIDAKNSYSNKSQYDSFKVYNMYSMVNIDKIKDE